MTKVKICGLRSAEDIQAVNRYLPDYIGFVFAEGSRRLVTAKTAKRLKSGLDSRIQAVGVFVNQPVTLLEELVRDHVIDCVQLHGGEDDTYVKHLRQKISCPIIRVVSVAEEMTKLPEDADYLLFDTASAQHGGTGKAFNWDVLKDIKKQFFLAGGLSMENVEEAIDRVTPYSVDVSSGVETAGVKDEKKISRFIKLVRGGL